MLNLDFTSEEKEELMWKWGYYSKLKPHGASFVTFWIPEGEVLTEEEMTHSNLRSCYNLNTAFDRELKKRILNLLHQL